MVPLLGDGVAPLEVVGGCCALPLGAARFAFLPPLFAALALLPLDKALRNIEAAKDIIEAPGFSAWPLGLGTAGLAGRHKPAKKPAGAVSPPGAGAVTALAGGGALPPLPFPGTGALGAEAVAVLAGGCALPLAGLLQPNKPAKKPPGAWFLEDFARCASLKAARVRLAPAAAGTVLATLPLPVAAPVPVPPLPLLPAAVPETLPLPLLPEAVPATLPLPLPPAAVPVTLPLPLLPAAVPETLPLPLLPPVAAPATLPLPLPPAAVPATLPLPLLPEAAPATLPLPLLPEAAPVTLPLFVLAPAAVVEGSGLGSALDARLPRMPVPSPPSMDFMVSTCSRTAGSCIICGSCVVARCRAATPLRNCALLILPSWRATIRVCSCLTRKASFASSAGSAAAPRARRCRFASEDMKRLVGVTGPPSPYTTTGGGATVARLLSRTTRGFHTGSMPLLPCTRTGAPP